jgi:hypothetical protein
MELNKSDRNYLILILVIVISVLSLKIKPVNFRIVLKAIVLGFLLYFISKRDVKLSLFLTILLFALNQNGIGNSIDFFENNEEENNEEESTIPVIISEEDKIKCIKSCYKDDSINLEDCDNLCEDLCTLQCESELTDDQKFSECSNICSLKENFANNNNKNNNSNNKQLVSDERGCRIKCLDHETSISLCKEQCSKPCINTCTSSTRNYENCAHMCSQ